MTYGLVRIELACEVFIWLNRLARVSIGSLKVSMNNLLNIVVRKLIATIFTKHRYAAWAPILAAAILTVAGITLLKPVATAQPATQTPKQHSGYPLKGRVVHVADGDTFTLLVNSRQHRIRLASIDAPEVGKDRQRPGQALAQASKNALAGMVAGKTLELVCFEQDRYERDVCDVPLSDGVTANEKQVATGMAWANMEGQGKYMRNPLLLELERRARQARLGLWQTPDPVSPWVWRYQCWKQAQC